MQHSIEIRGFILDLNSSGWQKENQVIAVVCTVLRLHKLQTRHK
jgi:hypothetical protein